MKFIDIYFKWVKIIYCYSGIEKILQKFVTLNIIFPSLTIYTYIFLDNKPHEVTVFVIHSGYMSL